MRPRLLAVLGRRFDVRLLAIEAGAGFGKTTLLAHAILENRLDAVGRDIWLSCDSSDSSSSSFLDGLLRSTGAEPPGRTATTVDDVAARLWMLAPERVCLIVDDAHLLAPGSSGEAALVALAEALPANAGLVVGSRRPVPIRRTRLELHHQALAISEADLRLDNDELTELARRRGWDSAALSGVGGWPALAEMVAATGVDGATRFVHEEVLARLDPSLQHAFLGAVAIGAADRALLEAAIGEPVDLEAIAAVPLVAYDRAVGIRPHQIWAELLTSELAVPEIAAVRFRAAQRFRDTEQFGGAFELLAAAGDWDQAISVIVPACNDQRRPPWPDVLARWRQLVPAELVHSPEVVYLDAMIERAADPWSPSCRDAFDQSIRAFHQAGRKAEALSCSVRASYSNWLRADLPAIERDHAVALAASAHGVLPAAIVHANEATQADIRGDGPWLRRAAAGTRDTEPRLRHFTGYHQVVADLYDGSLGPTDADRRRGKRGCSRRGVPRRRDRVGVRAGRPGRLGHRPASPAR